MSVDFRRGALLVPQETLVVPEVRSFLEEMCGKGVGESWNQLNEKDPPGKTREAENPAIDQRALRDSNPQPPDPKSVKR